MSNPEDELFRAVFSDPRHAGPLLFQGLPPKLRTPWDWQSLAPAPAELLADLPPSPHTDLLFQMRPLGGGLPTYFLMERRMGASHCAVLEVLMVVIRVMERLALAHPGEVPRPIVPLVVHHGPEPWDAPTRLLDCMALDGLPPEVRAYLEDCQLQFEILVFDLAAVSEADTLRGVLGVRLGPKE